MYYNVCSLVCNVVYVYGMHCMQFYLQITDFCTVFND